MGNSNTEDQELKYIKTANDHYLKEEFAEAEYFYKKIVKLDPENAEAWYKRGKSLKAMEQYSKALFCFDQLCKIEPNNVKSWYNKAYCQIKNYDFKNAMDSLDKCIELDSNYAAPLMLKSWLLVKMKESQ